MEKAASANTWYQAIYAGFGKVPSRSTADMKIGTACALARFLIVIAARR
jgi:hypothetical protein